MKSISFRPTSLFLCLMMVLVLAAVPARAADPTPADLVPMDPAQQAISHVSSSPVPTEAQAYAAMNAFRPRYPEGMRYTNDDFYEWNGGSGAPDQDVFDLGTPGVISTQIPYRPYYLFKGWSTSATAATASYQPGQSITLTESVTLYAVWAADPNAITGNTFPKTYTATINSPYQEYSFRFTPSVTAFYCFESSCESSMDPVAYLADTSGNELAHNDDGGENANFKLSLLLTAGKPIR